MMFVLMAAAAMALFVKIQQHTNAVLPAGWKIDVPSLFLLAIALTAVALGSWKEHSAVQTMLQVTLACVGCLTLIWIGEAQYERAIRYWCQGTFAATVTIPMLARRFVKSGMPRGPRRDWWKKTCEAVFFSFLTMMLVTAGGLFQVGRLALASSLPAISATRPARAGTPQRRGRHPGNCFCRGGALPPGRGALRGLHRGSLNRPASRPRAPDRIWHKGAARSRRQPRARDRLAGLHRQRDHARPGRQRVVLLSSMGGPVRTLADASSIGSDRIDVALSSPGAGPRTSRHRPGTRCSDSAWRTRVFSSGSSTGRAAEDDDRAVIHRVVERRAGQDEPVDQRHGDADLGPAGHRLEHPAAGRAVHVEPIAHPHVQGRDHERPPVDHEADVTHRRLVEDRVDQGAIIDPRAASGARSSGRWVGSGPSSAVISLA